MSIIGRELRSTIRADGKLTLALHEVELAEPVDDEILVRIEGAPINPSDIVLMLGPADLSSMRETGDHRPGLEFTIPDDRLNAVTGRPDQTAFGRVGHSLPVGIEGAGTVVAAGEQAEALRGRVVSMSSLGMYAQYRKVRAKDVIVLPEGMSAEQGAAMFINPMTALGFVETARKGGHTAIVQTAAAASVARMFLKVCLADGIPLVNIVRSSGQVALLREMGAEFVLNSKDDDFREQLVSAIEKTGATIVFDPIGGGRLASDILEAMEEGAIRRMPDNPGRGSRTFKELYIYGFLDDGPTILHRGRLGEEWTISNWHLPEYLQKAKPEAIERMRQRIVSELTTTFVNNYTRTIGLADILKPDVLRACMRKATGEKFLIDPSQH